MSKTNVTLSVDSLMYDTFKQKCIKDHIKYGEKLESFMSGYANNQKISDFLSFSEITNPRIDIPIEDIHDIIADMSPERVKALLWKLDEWKTRLMKK